MPSAEFALSNIFFLAFCCLLSVVLDSATFASFLRFFCLKLLALIYLLFLPALFFLLNGLMFSAVHALEICLTTSRSGARVCIVINCRRLFTGRFSGM